MWPAACSPRAFHSYQPQGKVNTAVSLWLIFLRCASRWVKSSIPAPPLPAALGSPDSTSVDRLPKDTWLRVLNFGVINQQCRKEVVLCSSLNTWHFRQKTLTQKAELVFETRMRHLVRRFIFQQQYHDCAAKSCSEEKFWELNSSGHPIRPVVIFFLFFW